MKNCSTSSFVFVQDGEAFGGVDAVLIDGFDGSLMRLLVVGGMLCQSKKED